VNLVEVGATIVGLDCATGLQTLSDASISAPTSAAPLFASQPDVKRYVRHYIQCFITGDRPSHAESIPYFFSGA
jgi:hypothetical protein